MTTDDAYLVKMMGAGRSHAEIAVKLGMTAEQVKARWLQIQSNFLANQVNGFVDMCDLFLRMANQYQLLGESMKELAAALNDTMTVEELEHLVTEDRTKTITNLKTGCIVLRPFTPPITPEAAAKAARNS